MKNKSILGIAIAVALLAAGCTGKPLSRESLPELQKTQLPAFTPPTIIDRELAGGARVFLLEDHVLPIVTFSVTVKAGSIYEPADRVGVADLTAMIMRDGGTAKMTPDEVDAFLDDRAVQLSFDMTREMLEASMKSLATEFDGSLDLFFDLLFTPRFDETRLDINKLKYIEELKRDEDDAETIAARDFKKLIYGDDSPWARWPTVDGVSRLNADDVRAFWKRFVRPRNILISAAGDFDADKLIARIEGCMQGVPNDEIDFPPVAAVKKEWKPAHRSVAKDLNQAYIYMGHLGIKRHNPDKFALQVMNTVLGGGSFKSRLTEEIRSSLGLAYSVWSHFGWGTDYGLFRIYAATKSQNEDEVIGLVRKQVSELADTGAVTPYEFTFAKDFVLNGLIFEFDNSYKIARSSAQYYFWGYPSNYWEVYRDGIRAVTTDDIKRVAHTYLHPEDLRVLVVGPSEPRKP